MRRALENLIYPSISLKPLEYDSNKLYNSSNKLVESDFITSGIITGKLISNVDNLVKSSFYKFSLNLKKMGEGHMNITNYVTWTVAKGDNLKIDSYVVKDVVPVGQINGQLYVAINVDFHESKERKEKIDTITQKFYQNMPMPDLSAFANFKKIREEQRANNNS